MTCLNRTHVPLLEHMLATVSATRAPPLSRPHCTQPRACRALCETRTRTRASCTGLDLGRRLEACVQLLSDAGGASSIRLANPLCGYRLHSHASDTHTAVFRVYRLCTRGRSRRVSSPQRATAAAAGDVTQGRELAAREAAAGEASFRFGFHARPSIQQLHLHVVSQVQSPPRPTGLGFGLGFTSVSCQHKLSTMSLTRCAGT